MQPPNELLANTYISFQLDREIFAADVGGVHQIVGFQQPTQIPGAPYFMRGVYNIRGRLVPILDLRLKLGMSETVESKDTCILVVDLAIGQQKMLVGTLADAVHDIFELAESDIAPVPQFNFTANFAHIKGIGKRDGRFVIILNFDNIFSTDEMLRLYQIGDDKLITS